MAKKSGGIAVMKSLDGTMQGRIVTETERDELLNAFGEDFKSPTPTGENFTIGKEMKSDVAIGFRTLPGEAIFGIILKTAENECNLLVYAEKEPAEFVPILNALGGIATFTDDVIRYGKGYSASYPGGSGMWEMTCLPPNK